uniref:Cell division protein n=1 Tax=Lacunastrum gracillimum TaxID=427913 RepID=A0A2U8GGY0_9CHLO|nr:cell division protein [Lacunastrum gracillimum]AWI68012.1 cell division protein [Lacunastrum gracillimum]
MGNENLDSKNNNKHLQLEKIRIKDLDSFSHSSKNDRVLLMKSFQINPGSFFPQKKIFMQYWIFPFIGFVGLTWNKNSNLFEIIDFKKSFFNTETTRVNNILFIKNNEKKFIGCSVQHSHNVKEKRSEENNNFNKIPESVESSFAFPLKKEPTKEKHQINQNNLYEYYFMAKNELEQKLSMLNTYGEESANLLLSSHPSSERILFPSNLRSHSFAPFGISEIDSLRIGFSSLAEPMQNKISNQSKRSEESKEKESSFYSNHSKKIVPTFTYNVKKIYEKSPKKLLPISGNSKNLNTKAHHLFKNSKTFALSNISNIIKRNTRFSIIQIPNTFFIKSINLKQKEILHNHPIHSYEKANILLDNAIKNFLLTATPNFDKNIKETSESNIPKERLNKNFKNLISIYSLDKLKNQSYFINKNITKSKLLFNFSQLKTSQKNQDLKNCLFEQRIKPNLENPNNSQNKPIINKEPKETKIKNFKTSKVNEIFVKVITEKLKFDLDKILFSKKFKTKFIHKIHFNNINIKKNQKSHLKFVFLFDSNLKNTNNIIKKFKKIKGNRPSIQDNNMKNYIYELSVLNYWKKLLNLLLLNPNKISYSSKFFKNEDITLGTSFTPLLSLLRGTPRSQSESTLCFNFAEAKKPMQTLLSVRPKHLVYFEYPIAKETKKEKKEDQRKERKEKDFILNEAFFNKFAKIQKLLVKFNDRQKNLLLKKEIYSRNFSYNFLNFLESNETNFTRNSLFTFQTSKNPIKLKNPIITSRFSYKFLYNKKPNLLYDSYFYSYNINSKENYINKNFYRKKNNKVLGRFMLKSIISKMNDFNKFHKIESGYNRKFSISSESKRLNNKAKNSTNFILNLKKIWFINLNTFYSKLYCLINNLHKILYNGLNKKITSLESNILYKPDNNIKIIKSNSNKKLIKKKDSLKFFKLDLNSKTLNNLNQDLKKNKKEKIFRTLLSYKFSQENEQKPLLYDSFDSSLLHRSNQNRSNEAKEVKKLMQENFKNIKFKKNVLKLKNRMKHLLYFDSNKNIKYKYYKKNTFIVLLPFLRLGSFSSSQSGLEPKQTSLPSTSSNTSAPLCESNSKQGHLEGNRYRRFRMNESKKQEAKSKRKKERHYPNKVSLNRILQRIGFVFLSELKIKQNYHVYKKESLIQRFEKEKSLQKRHRRKKLKLETRRRKKRKRFYPRPIWLRYSLYKKFLNFRHSYNNFYYKKKVKPSSYEVYYKNKKLSADILKKNKKIFNISHFLKNQKLKNKIYRNNKQKWGYFIQDTPKFEKISLKKINFFPHFPIFQNKDYYKVSNRILAEFQPLCWKSYWLRSNLTPYMNRIQKNFAFMKQVEKTNNLYNVNTFLYKVLGFFSYDFYSFKFTMLPFYSDFKNSFDNQHAFYISNLFFQENTNKIAEYNRIEFERFSEILKNVKFNMNLEGQLKPKSYKFIAWKYRLSSRELKAFNKKNFWYRLSYNMQPNLSSISPFVIFSNTFSKNSASIKPYGSSGTLRALWSFNKTNIFTFKEKNQIRDLWELTKLREQLKSNQTRKFLMNLIKVKNNLYLKDIFYLKSKKYANTNESNITNSTIPNNKRIHSASAPHFFDLVLSQNEETKEPKQTEAEAKSQNTKDFKKDNINLKNLSYMNFSTLKKLQTAQRKLVLMSLFQQKAQKKYSNNIKNKKNNISYNYYIRILKSKISNLKLNTKKNSNQKVKNFVFLYTLKNKKDSPLLNVAKPRLLKPSSYFWWSSKNFQMPFNLNTLNKSYMSDFKKTQNITFSFPSFAISDYSESNISALLRTRLTSFASTALSLREPNQNERETKRTLAMQQSKISERSEESKKERDKFIFYNILIFSILFHFSILFSFIRIPELRGLLKFEILLFYKISNNYFIILYSIYDLLKKYKVETLKTYNSLYEKTYKLFSYINILDLESKTAHSVNSNFASVFHIGADFHSFTSLSASRSKEAKNLNSSLSANFAKSKRKSESVTQARAKSKKLAKYERELESMQRAKELGGIYKIVKDRNKKTKKGNFDFYNKKNNRQKKHFASYYFLYNIFLYKNLRSKKYYYFSILNQKSNLKLQSINPYDKSYNFKFNIKQWVGALKYPKIYNKDFKSYNNKAFNTINFNKDFPIYITSQAPFLYSFAYNIVEFIYTQKILNKLNKIANMQKVDLKVLKIDIKRNSMKEFYKRFMSLMNIQTQFALFFLYLSYSVVHLSLGLFESSYQLLLKVIDLFESFLLIIYKFLEKPAELMIEWIAQFFLIEWSSDASTFIPETLDMYFWYSFQKFSRNSRILGFVEFQNSTNLYNIDVSKIQSHSYNNEILDIEKTLGTSVLSFSISNILGFFMQRRLWNFFHLFIDSMLKPDIDLIVRQKKGKIFWDIWSDILIRAAEQYNINIPSLTSLKEEQEKLIERLIQDPAFINFSVLSHPGNQKNFISSTSVLSLASVLRLGKGAKEPMHRLVHSANRSKVKPMQFGFGFAKQRAEAEEADLKKTMRNKQENFYKTKSWSSNQYITFNLKDTDLFLDISPPKSLLSVHFINGYEPIQYTLGSIMCEIYSGLFSHKVSKNLLIVNSQVSDLPLRSSISSNFLLTSHSNQNSFDSQSRGSYGSLIIQALAGESEIKMMIDNANRYASIQRGVAVGMKLLRDVFESIVLQTPCFFLIEDLHVIGERRPMLISDDENSYEKEFSIFGFEQDEESEKNQMIYQSSRHSINDFRRPYKGDFSMAIPTNLYNKNLYSFKTFSNNFKPTHQKKYPISLPSLLRFGLQSERVDVNKFEKNSIDQSFNISRLQIVSENFFAPPATSPFTILMMKEQRKLKPKKVVKQISWNSFVTENIITSKTDSIRVKVAILADITLRNFSYNKDMITDLLVIIDGVRSNRGFVVFATTHLPSILDPALRRPGRFDETISLPLLPNLMNRWSLFQMHFNQETLQKKVSKETFDRFDYGILTENFNFSQISNLISKTKLSCNINYNNEFLNIFVRNLFGSHFSSDSVQLSFSHGGKREEQMKLAESKQIKTKSPIIHPSQALQSFFIEKDSKIIPFNSSNFLVNNFKTKKSKNFKQMYSQISFGYFQIGNLLIVSDLLKDQTYFSLYNKSLILEQSSPFVYHTLYSSLNTFKTFIMRLLGGKIAEFLIRKNQRNLCVSFKKTNKNQLIKERTNQLNFSVMDHMIRYKSWHFATSLIFSILQKRFLYNKNLIITKMLSFDNPNQSSLREPPSPPASSLLMPSKKYENFKRIERDFQQKAVFSIYEKMQMHQKQRFLKRLYNKPVLESFKSQLSTSTALPKQGEPNSILKKRQKKQENRFTSFESSFKEFSYNKDSNLLKLSSSHSYYKNRLNLRHRFSLINQWWNGQLAEHNVEVTYLSDIDWRTMYIQSYSKEKNINSSKKDLLSDISYNNEPSYKKLGLKQSKSVFSLAISDSSVISNKTDSILDFPDADQHYNPRVRRWFLNANSWNYWLNFENTFYYEIYSHMIYECFNKTSLYFNENRELLDYFVYIYNVKGSLKESHLIFIYSRFYRK